MTDTQGLHTVERRRRGRNAAHPMERYLFAWARYVAHENRARALGYTQSAYREMVGAGSYQSATPEVDDDVLRMDTILRHDIPRTCMQVLWLHYVMPGDTKTKYEPGQSSQYYARLLMAHDVVMEQWELRTRLSVEPPRITSAHGN